MLHRAVSLYHELLTKGGLAESSRAVLDEGLERAREDTARPPFVSLLERSRRLCAMCYLLNRTRAEQRPPIGDEERPWYRPDLLRTPSSRPARLRLHRLRRATSSRPYGFS